MGSIWLGPLQGYVYDPTAQHVKGVQPKSSRWNCLLLEGPPFFSENWDAKRMHRWTRTWRAFSPMWCTQNSAVLRTQSALTWHDKPCSDTPIVTTQLWRGDSEVLRCYLLQRSVAVHSIIIAMVKKKQNMDDILKCRGFGDVTWLTPTNGRVPFPAELASVSSRLQLLRLAGPQPWHM